MKKTNKIKQVKPTPFQKWSVDYRIRTNKIYDISIPPWEAHEYAQAAWEECKRRCLEILRFNEGDGQIDTWAINEVEGL